VSDPLQLSYLAGYRTWRGYRSEEGQITVLSPRVLRRHRDPMTFEWSPIATAACDIPDPAPAPHRSHECGLYADVTWRAGDGGNRYTLLETDTPNHFRVRREFEISGAVLGGGRLQDHDTGWRAQSVQVLAIAADLSGVIPSSEAAVRRTLADPEVKIEGLDGCSQVGPLYELADQWHVLILPPARIPALAEHVAPALGKGELRRVRIQGTVAISPSPMPPRWEPDAVVRGLETLRAKALPLLRHYWTSPRPPVRRLVSRPFRRRPLLPPVSAVKPRTPIEPGRDPNTAPETLVRLAASEDEAIRKQVAGNRSTPPSTLVDLAADPSVEVRRSVAFNMATPVEGLWALRDDTDELVMTGLATHPDTPAGILRMLLARSSDVYLTARLAAHPSLPTDLLESLADPESTLPHPGAPRVLTALAGNPYTPGGTLSALSEPTNSRATREGVARNRSSPPDALIAGAHDEHAIIRLLIAKRHDAPATALEDLAHDPEMWIREAVAENVSTPPDTLDAMARTGTDTVQGRVSRNPSTRTGTLCYLVEFGRRGSDAQRNAELRVYRQDVIPDPGPGDPSFRWGAVDPEILRSDHELLVRVVHSPDANAELLTDIVRSPCLAEDWTVRVAIAGHAQTPASTLEGLADDPHWMVRGSVAFNANTPSKILERLAVDPDPVVRCAVAANEKTPLDVKRFLVWDEDPATASSARLAVWRADVVGLAGLGVEL